MWCWGDDYSTSGVQDNPMVFTDRGQDQKVQGTGWSTMYGVSLLGSQSAVSCFCRGRFGQVHRCTQKSTGLSLAAKIIKVKSAKDRVRHLPWTSWCLGPSSGLLYYLIGPLALHFPSPLHADQEPCHLPCLFSMSPTLCPAHHLIPWTTGSLWISRLPSWASQVSYLRNGGSVVRTWFGC